MTRKRRSIRVWIPVTEKGGIDSAEWGWGAFCVYRTKDEADDILVARGELTLLPTKKAKKR